MKTNKSLTLSSITVALCAIVMLVSFPSDALAWKFVVYGDTRTNQHDHETALGIINSHAGSYDYIFNTGDVVQRGDRSSDWNEWRNAMLNVMGSTMQSGSPYYISCPGNHDNTEMSAGLTNWHNYLSYQYSQWPENDANWFYFDHNNARFIILDYEKINNSQRNFLAEAIETNNQQWLFAFWHAPTIPYGDKSYEEQIHRDFSEPLYLGGCDIIFNGHTHTYARTKKLKWDEPTDLPGIDNINGTTQVIVGNAGAERDLITNPNSEMNGAGTLIDGNYLEDDFLGVCVIEINGDQLNLKHILDNGTVLDEVNYTPNYKPFGCPECPTQYTLTAGVSGAGNVSPSDGTYDEGTIVTVTATPSVGWQFDNWSGDVSGTANPKNVTMNASKNITANFSLIGGGTTVTIGATDDSFILDNSTSTNKGAEPTISVKNQSKKAGLVKFDLSGISEPVVAATLQVTGKNAASGGNLSVYSVANDSWNESTVTFDNAPSQGSLLGATSLGAAGTVYSIDVSVFVIDESNGDGVVSLWLNDNQEGGLRYDFSSKEDVGDNGPKLVLTLDGDPLPTYTLATSAVNGSVSPAGGTYNEGTVVTLTATPDAGYGFSHWSGSVSGTANPTNITMNGNKSVTANFVEVQVPVYTLTTSVVGSGSVSPSGGSYEEGTVVTLTATPASGWLFDSWSGDASGSSATTSVTMNSNKSVTATFVEEPIGPITSTVTASNDAYVRNGNYSGTNYGSAAILEVKTTTNANAKRFSYLQFDLSNIGAVTSAQLKVKSIGNENADIKVYSTSDSWDEGSILWSNKPALGNLQATLEIGANGNYTVDVTSYVAAQASGDNTASFALKCATSRLMTLSSKEGTYAPRLIIKDDGSPSAAINAVTSNVEMYPNPTTGLVNISVNDAGFSNGIVKVYNENGALLETTTVDNANSTVVLKGEAGIYLIELSYNGNIETIPVIKE